MMNQIIPEALEVLDFEFPAALFGSREITLLKRTCRDLAPLRDLQLGFECRLAAAENRVDLQQLLFAKGGPFQVLSSMLRERRTSSGEMGQEQGSYSAVVWRRIEEFCDEKAKTGFHSLEGIFELWLEFDVEEEVEERPCPSLFVGFLDELGPEQRLHSARESLARLGGEIASGPALMRNLEGCFECCGEEAIVTHVGIMLARPEAVVRACIKGLAFQEVLPFLRRLGVPGGLELVEESLVSLEGLVDEVRLIVDIGEDCAVYPRVGLECFMRRGAEAKQRWEAYFRWLVERGYSSVEKAEAVLGWQRYIFPPLAKAPWPAALLAESLVTSPERLQVIECGLNHVKLDIIAPHPPVAKAYIYAIRSWMEASTG